MEAAALWLHEQNERKNMQLIIHLEYCRLFFWLHLIDIKLELGILKMKTARTFVSMGHLWSERRLGQDFSYWNKLYEGEGMLEHHKISKGEKEYFFL